MLIRGLLLVLLMQMAVLLNAADHIPPATDSSMVGGCSTLYLMKSFFYTEPLDRVTVPTHYCENGSANGRITDRTLATVSPCRWGMSADRVCLSRIWKMSPIKRFYKT